MLSNYLVLGALSLFVVTTHCTTSNPSSSELDAENHDNLFIPVVEIPANESSETVLVRSENKKDLPILASLKSLLSWKDNDTSSCSINQLKVAIEAIHEKHEALLSHIKCVIPTPPSNCSSLATQPSKWNWTSWIPSDHKPHNFFHPSDKNIGPIAAVFISALEHLEKKQNSIYEFLTCACEKKSNCTAKPSWHNLFNTTHWHNKIHKLNPFNWHFFSISKPHKPTSAYYSGTLHHKPILAIFNHSSELGGQTGFVVALTGGQVPSFPSAIYGSTDSNANASESGGFGGYASASLPTYSGSIVLGHFPNQSGTSQTHQSNSTSSSAASGSSSTPGANSINIPRCIPSLQNDCTNVEATSSYPNINNDNVPNTNKQAPTQ